MNKRERQAFDEALSEFDEGVERLDGALNKVLVIGLSAEGEEDDDDIMSGEDNYSYCD